MANLLESASFEEDENLKNKWSAILANATDPNNAFDLHNMFIDVLKQLSPLEASAMDYMWESCLLESGKRYQGNFSPQILYYKIIKEKGRNVMDEEYDRKKEALIVDNLMRLNLIEYLSPKIEERNRGFLSETKPEYVIKDKTAIQFTVFGNKFMEECNIE